MSLPALLAVSLITLARPAGAQAADAITLLRPVGQTVTIVAEPAVASRVPVLAQAIVPRVQAVTRWAGDRPPATVFLVSEIDGVPDLPGRARELPGAHLDLERSALHLSAGLVREEAGTPAEPLVRALSTFLVQSAIRQLAGARPHALPVWLVLGLLDVASLAPPTPVDARALADAPFLELLDPTLNEPFVELLGVHPALGTALSRAIVDDLTRRAAPSRIGEVVRALREADFDDAFARAYGLTLEGYAGDLRRRLGPGRAL